MSAEKNAAKMTDHTDKRPLIDGFTRGAADDFRQAVGSAEEQRKAICRYFKRGANVGFSHAEMIDFLGVSTPSVLQLAGYSDEEARCVMEMLADIGDDEIGRAVL